MRRFLLALLLAALPLSLGLSTAWLLQNGWLPNYTFVGRYQADLAALVSTGGALIAAGVLLAFFVAEWVNTRLTRVRQQEQRAATKARRRFFQRLDHELKNPLTVIRLGLTNLQQNPAPATEASLARIEQQTQRLQKLVKDLRALSELEAHGLEAAPVLLPEVIEEAVALAHSAPERADRTVNVNLQHVPWPLPPVLGDRDLLVVVFSNLLDNALKFTGAGGRVEVRATDDARAAVIEVADTGMGIPADDLEHVYEELYRGSNARAISGSGLGLALVQRIIQMHRGSIAIRSRPNQGTVITVRLPLAQTPKEPAAT